ncbi:hypothetical protein NDU88_004896 [Pleurodeles waltl]|uniref:Uncharacterized protein n=1 Tax=Pleurodeles waltl TaxID=8319 RepID=A0AAV7SK48_PLEWA|nr:hypothetical protein NDU88_004896 [Pleurodeles waltl]
MTHTEGWCRSPLIAEVFRRGSPAVTGTRAAVTCCSRALEATGPGVTRCSLVFGQEDGVTGEGTRWSPGSANLGASLSQWRLVEGSLEDGSLAPRIAPVRLICEGPSRNLGGGRYQTGYLLELAKMPEPQTVSCLLPIENMEPGKYSAKRLLTPKKGKELRKEQIGRLCLSPFLAGSQLKALILSFTEFLQKAKSP